MKFFVPHANDSEQAERVWESVYEFMKTQGYQPLKKRVYEISYSHKGKPCRDTVGGKDRYGHEDVIILLECSNLFLCCTPSRGVIRGEPILIGKGVSEPDWTTQVKYFEEG